MKIELEVGDVKQGFYVFTPRVDYFFVTDRTKRTSALCNEIDELLKADGCTYRGRYGAFTLEQMLELSTIEKNCSEKWGIYYSIRGDGFAVGEFEKDKETKVYKLTK